MVGGLALAILFAALLVRNVDLGQVVLAASRVSMYVLIASAGLVVAGYAVRARRWQLMLRGAGVNATYRQAAPIFFAALAQQAPPTVALAGHPAAPQQRPYAIRAPPAIAS